MCYKWSHNISTSLGDCMPFQGDIVNHLNSMMQQSTRRLMLWQYMLCPWSCSGSIIIKASGSDKLFEKLLFNSPLVISLNLQKRYQRKELLSARKGKIIIVIFYRPCRFPACMTPLVCLSLLFSLYVIGDHSLACAVPVIA